MGEAKRRGTFEQRKVESEERHRKAREESWRKMQEAEAALTPGQREQRFRARMALSAARIVARHGR